MYKYDPQHEICPTVSELWDMIRNQREEIIRLNVELAELQEKVKLLYK